MGDIAERFRHERPFDGLRIAVRIYIEPKTGVLIRALPAIEIMDLGFGLQALSLERIALEAENLGPGDRPVPLDIDETIARATVAQMARP